MESISNTEENYLKAIFKICETDDRAASTNAIAQEMQTSAASVSDMLKRLAKKQLIHYEKWKGVTLTDTGSQLATNLVRKHRLWEVFLKEKLQFTWDEVHEIAEQLEHIRSPKLIERLDQFLGHPKFDPHGDPIPDADGNFSYRKQIPLSSLKPGEIGVIVGVQEHSPTFLQYLDRMKLVLGTRVRVMEQFEYDESVRLRVNDAQEILVSNKVSQNLFVEKAPHRSK